ncbi:MAG: EI24 domain-containing protein [Rhizomicrobium sp.]
MFASLRRALGMLFDRDFRGLVLWTLVLTAALFVALLAGVEYGLARLPELGSPWVNRFLELIAPVALLLSVFVLGAPVAATIGAAFMERIAARVDAHFYPGDSKVRRAPALRSVGESVRLIGLAILINLALLPVDVGIPGLPEAATVLVNGWLLGREFFDLAALRHQTPEQVTALRHRHGGKIYLAGLFIALFTAIPGIDLIAPFFGTALMAHLSRRLAHLESSP